MGAHAAPLPHYSRYLVLLSLAVSAMWPGLASRPFAAGEEVPLRGEKLSSTRWGGAYAWSSLPFCTPRPSLPPAHNLGEVLQGARIENAPYALRVGEGGLRALCKRTLEARERELWAQRVKQEYRGQLLLDNLPVSTLIPAKPPPPLSRAPPALREVGRSPPPSTGRYVRGFPLGYTTPGGVAYLHNHLEFTVWIHEVDGGEGGGEKGSEGARGAQVVGFEVRPSSRRYSHERRWPDDYEGSDGEGRDVLNLSPDAVGLKREKGEA